MKAIDRKFFLLPRQNIVFFKERKKVIEDIYKTKEKTDDSIALLGLGEDRDSQLIELFLIFEKIQENAFDSSNIQPLGLLQQKDIKQISKLEYKKNLFFNFTAPKIKELYDFPTLSLSDLFEDLVHKKTVPDEVVQKILNKDKADKYNLCIDSKLISPKYVVENSNYIKDGLDPWQIKYILEQLNQNLKITHIEFFNFSPLINQANTHMPSFELDSSLSILAILVNIFTCQRLES